MIVTRRAQERGHVLMGWLDTWHTFSFGDYYDPRHMGCSVLRVINDDRIAGHSGFGMHGHRNMEILTVMLRGVLTHRDSMGNEEALHAGECQWMSAGKGVMHSEYNHGDDEVHLLQIWLLPDVTETPPGYQQRAFPATPGMTLIASPDGRQDSFTMRQQAAVWRGRYCAGETVELSFEYGGQAWLHVIGGRVVIAGSEYGPGDACQVTGQRALALQVDEDADFIYFDLP